MSKASIDFSQEYPLVVLIVGLLLCLGLIIREWFRENPRRKIIRVLSAALLGISLLGIIYRPALKQSLNKSNLIVLTSGFDQSTRDSLERKLSRFEILDLNQTQDYPGLEAFGNIYVLGAGIPKYDLWKFENKAVKFLPRKGLKGLTRLNIPKAAEQDRSLLIKGEYLTEKESEKLILIGQEGRLDSANVGKDNPYFELNLLPKTVGNFVYNVVAESEDFEEKIPLVIEPGNKLKVLMVNAFPTFEMRYLKTFLARKGHLVAVRNQVSKDRFRSEFYNTPERSIQRLTEEELARHDVLIMDWQSLSGLSTNERNLIDNAIEVEGLGLFIQPEEAVFGKSRWLPLELTSDESDKVSASLAGTSTTFSKYEFELKKASYQFALLEDDRSLLAIAERQGLGKVGTTVLKDTYRQGLTGDSLVYAHVWSEILNGLSKENNEANTLLGQEELVYPYEPFSFELQNPESTEVKIDNLRIPLQQNPDIPERWQGTYWPREAGWKNMIVATDTLPFYVHAPEGWSTRKAYQTMAANQQFFQGQRALNISELFHYPEIQVFWFYLLFLVTAGFLWLEPKL